MAYAELNASGLGSLFTYSNNVSGNIFGVGIMVSLYVIILGYLHMRGEEFADSSIVAGFITSLVTAFLYFVNLVNGWHLFMCIALMALSTVWSYWQKAG